MPEERVPVNVRIDRELVKKMDESGSTKTEIVTAAIELYFSYDKEAIEKMKGQLVEYERDIAVLQARNEELEKAKELTLKMYDNLREDSVKHLLQAQTLINHITESKRGWINRLLKKG